MIPPVHSENLLSTALSDRQTPDSQPLFSTITTTLFLQSLCRIMITPYGRMSAIKKGRSFRHDPCNPVYLYYTAIYLHGRTKAWQSRATPDTGVNATILFLKIIATPPLYTFSRNYTTNCRQFKRPMLRIYCNN